MTSRKPLVVGLLTVLMTLALVSVPTNGFGQGPDGPGGRGGRGGIDPGPPPTPRESVTVDLTGYWVSLVTEDWHWRMSLPEAGDVSSIPFTPDEEKRAVLMEWDPEADIAAGEQCRGYGAAAVMRIPTRLRIAWDGDDVLQVETDAGMQTRRLRFGDSAGVAPGPPSLQGFSVAEWWQPPGGRGFGGRGRGLPPPATALGPPGDGPREDTVEPEPLTDGTLQVVTTNLTPGYLRKNGVPYSAQTRVTEYYHRTPETYGNTYLIVTTIVEDPEYLTGPFITSSHFRRLPDTDNGWNPTPCSAY
jgi:hypothetical protein